MSLIHATAIVDAAAELDVDVHIGPYAVIGPAVKLGRGTQVGAHCVIQGPTTIGCDNHIFPHAALGAAPQDMKYRGEATQLVIGDRNTIREFCTFNRGTAQGGGVTRMGHDNWVMAYVHLAHDVQVGSHTILANNATLAGHVQVGDWVLVGGLTGVHQFCKIGSHAMTGFQSHVAQDVPPFMTVAGNPLAVHGINAEGLRRRGFGRQRIQQVKHMHRLLYRDSLSLVQARAAIAALVGAVPSGDQGGDQGGDQDLQCMLDFLAAAERGIVR